MEPFYVTLPSNTGFYPENTISHYRTKLPHAIALPQHWEVGLCELIFPSNWHNIVKGGNTVTFKRKKGKIIRPVRRVRLEVRTPDINDLLHEMNRMINSEISTGGKPIFSVGNNGKVLLHLVYLNKVTLTEDLAAILGLEGTEFEDDLFGVREPQNMRYYENMNLGLSFEGEDEDELQNDVESSFSIPEGHHATPTEVLKLINKLMVSLLYLPRLEGDEGFKMSEKNIITLKLPYAGIELILDRPLAALLGFEQTSFTGQRKITADFPFDIKNSFYSLFIYSDIIEQQVIGDTYAQLLQVTPAPQRTNTIVSQTFNPVQYVGLQTNNFETINIAIRNSFGDYVPFTTGLSIVKLHFRPRR